MDVYHKVLTKIYEETDGKDTVDVDLVDLLKREGFFPSLNDISKFLMDESWVTETKTKHVIRLTHWGAAEAKKSLAGLPNKGQELERFSKRAVTGAKELLVMLEEFNAKPDKKKFSTLKEAYGNVGGLLGKIEQNL